MRLFKKTVLFLVIWLSFFGTSQSAYTAPKNGTQTLPILLEWSLDTLTREPVRKFLREVFKEELKISEEIQKKYGLPDKIREVTESQLLEIVFQNPELGSFMDKYLQDIPRIKMDNANLEDDRTEWRARFKELAEKENLKENLATVLKDPLHAVTLGSETNPGWKNIEFFANHSTIYNGQKIPASNMKNKIIEVINTATKEIVVNVFDFDLKEIAEALIAKAKEGVSVRVGIDGNVIKERPEVKEVFDLLSNKKNLKVHAVSSVGLNHQKLVAIDWSLPAKAKSILSSGNFTQSCIGPEGDGINLSVKPKTSIPNANHMLVVDGMILAQIINHELSKTIDEGYQLRGREYPLSGAFKIVGPKRNGKNSYIIIAFSPGGGLGDINRDMIAQVIDRSTGPIRMVQFAASSETIESALFEKAKEKMAVHDKFDFASIGDTPFAMAKWSMFMDMSGYTIEDKSEGEKQWITIKDNRWEKLLGKNDYQLLKDNIKVAPPIYGHHMAIQPGGTKVELTSKIHHKILMTNAKDNYVFVQGSYNFSDAALGNQEYITVIVDEELYKRGMSIYDGLASESKASVEQTALFRNSRKDDRDPHRRTIRDSESAQVQKKYEGIPEKNCKEKIKKII